MTIPIAYHIEIRSMFFFISWNRAWLIVKICRKIEVSIFWKERMLTHDVIKYHKFVCSITGKIVKILSSIKINKTFISMFF